MVVNRRYDMSLFYYMKNHLRGQDQKGKKNILKLKWRLNEICFTSITDIKMFPFCPFIAPLIENNKI